MTAPTTTTTAGPVRGAEEDGLHVYRGIPYAAAPFGPLLFRPPQPRAPWEGVLDCSSFGPICPQPALNNPMMGEPEPQGEDCLRLNVWKPAGRSGLPVMVWLHGGASLFGSGSAPGNRGETFARDGVVFVSLNYRLGALGFLHAGAVFADRMEASGNYGIADQVAALRWVHDNIARFGGDPDNVTVFGVSAGASYVATLLACPPAKSLFQRAIAQSAPAQTVEGMPAAVAAGVARAYFDLAGRPTTAADVERLGVDDLLATQAKLLADLRAGRLDDVVGDMTVPFFPVRETDLQPESVIESVAAGSASEVSLIVGTNLDEMALTYFLTEVTGESETTPRPWTDATAASLRPIYENARPDASTEQVDLAIESDRYFRIGSLRLAEGHAASGGTTRMYLFTWPTAAFGGRLGACHGLEVPFVFDDLDSPIGQLFAGPEAPLGLAHTMHSAWIAFATTGDPCGADSIDWPIFDEEKRETMIFDERSEVVADPERHRRAAWDHVPFGHNFPST